MDTISWNKKIIKCKCNWSVIIVSVIVLEAFINMLPSKFQNDPDIQKAYESRVVQSLKELA